MFVDLAADLGVPFARSATRRSRAIADTLDPGMEAANPLDAWGTGIDGDRIFRDAFAAFADDPAVSASVFCVDMTLQGEPYDEGYLVLAREAYESTTEPFCVLSNLASAVTQRRDPDASRRGDPGVGGHGERSSRARALLRRRRARVRVPPVDAGAEVASSRPRLGGATGSRPACRLSELDGLALLADYGLRTAAARPAASTQSAVEPRTAIGLPGGAEDGRAGHARTSPTSTGCASGSPTRDAVRTRLRGHRSDGSVRM